MASSPVSDADDELAEPDVRGEDATSLLASLRPIEWQVLRHPTVVEAGSVLVLSGVALGWPARTDLFLARVIAVATIVVGAFGLRASIRHKQWPALISSVVAVAAGVWILTTREESSERLAQLIAATLIVMGLRSFYEMRRDGPDSTAWPLVRSVALTAAGVVLVVVGAPLLTLFVVGAAVASAAVLLVALAMALDGRRTELEPLQSSASLIHHWLLARPKEAGDRRELYGKLLYEGPLFRRRLSRFVILMSFASVIASMGVITDSTAVVIGAMLIAPLMTPLMATSMSLIMGWPRRLQSSALIALLGIGIAISIGFLLGYLVPTVIDTDSNTQILARSSPTMLDLITALAAGAAGAYGLSRPDVSDALPGVAIAISLVPPLTVVGIAWSQGDITSGNGALLLFITNALAILVMGGVTFIATGVTPIERVAEHQQRLRTWFAALATAAAVVIGALMLNGAELGRAAFESGTAEEVAEDWIESAATFDIVDLAIEGDVVTVFMVGPADGAPSAQDLADALSLEFGQPMTADLRHIIQERTTASSG